MALQIKRGTNLQRLELLLAQGEPFYVTDNVSLGVAPMWIGDGTTFGGVASMSPVTIDELNDIEIVTVTDDDFLQYDSSVGQWKNSQNINVVGTTTLNGAATAKGGITSKKTDALTQDIVYPVVLDHTHEKTAAYTGIATVAGETIVTFAANPTITAVGTRIRLSYVGPLGGMTGIAVDTTYYVYGISTPTLKLASTKANALAGIPLGTTGSCGGGTATIRAMPGFGVGVERTVNLAASSVVAMRDAVVTTNELTGTESFDYDVYLKQAGSLPSTPQLRVGSNGVVAFNTLNAATANLTNNLAVTGVTESTTTGTGAITVSGGVGIAGNLNVGGALGVGSLSTPGNVAITSNTPSTNNDTGALTVDGGVGINGRLNVGGDAHFSAVTRFFSTDDSSSVDTGAVTIDGGLGVNKNVFIGGYFRVLNQAVIDNDLTVGGNLVVNGTVTTVNSTTVQIDDKNIELGTVATPTDITANGGGITLKGATDKTITWNSTTGRWETNVGLNTPGSLIGNVSIADGNDNNTITTTTGDLILDAATNNIQVNGSLTTTGTFTNNGITAGDVNIGLGGSSIISATTGPLVLLATTGVQTSEDTPFSVLGAAQFGPTNNNTHGMYFYSQARTDLTFDANTTDVMRGLRGTVGVNDAWFIGGDSSGSSNGKFIIATGDDGSEPIVARQYTGAISDANSSFRELTLLDASGNTVLPGDLTITGNDIKSSTGSTALTLADTNVTVGGDLTINGNDIKSNGGTTALTLSGSAATVAGTLTSEGDLVVNGTTATFNNVDINGTLQDGVTLENAFTFGWNENNNRLNRPNFQATSGNTSGVRISGPNATTSSNARLSVFTSNDVDNGKFMGIRANNTAADAFSIFTGVTTAGVISNSSDSVAFANSDATVFATVNPAGTTTSTDLSTKSYTDTAISTAITALNLGTSNLVTSTTAANQILDIVSIAAFKTVKYVVQVTSAGAGTHVMECLVMHDNTTAYINVYGEMFSAASLTNISVAVSGSDMHLLVHPTNAVTSYKVTKTSITA